jgi:hypothetical protein
MGELDDPFGASSRNVGSKVSDDGSGGMTLHDLARLWRQHRARAPDQ